MQLWKLPGQALFVRNLKVAVCRTDSARERVGTAPAGDAGFGRAWAPRGSGGATYEPRAQSVQFVLVERY